MEISQHRSGDVSQPTRYPMPLHSRADRLGDNQPDAGTLARIRSVAAPDMDDDVGLHGAHPVLHRLVELG